MKFATKLTVLLVVIIVLSGVAISFFAYNSNLKTLKEGITNKLEERALHTMDKIDRNLYERHADIRIIATDSIISSRESTPKQITERLIEFRNTYKAYSSLSFFDLNRIRIADTSGIGIGKQHRMTKYWEEVLQGKISAASDIYESKSSGTMDIHFASPVKDDDGETFGVVVVRMPITKVHEIIKTAAGISKVEALEIDLIDKNGLLLYSNYNRKGILKDNLMMHFESEVKTGEELGSLTHYDTNLKEEVIMAFAKEQGYLDFKGNDWALMIHIPTRLAFAPAAELRNKIMIIFLPIIALAILISFFFSKTMIKPINSLRDIADKISKGNLAEPIEIKSKDEIGELAESFDNMRYSLKMVIDEYEKIKGKEELVKKLEKEIGERKKAEEELEDTFNLSPNMIAVCTTEGKFLKVNPSWEKVLGYTQKELLKLGWTKLVHPDDVEHTNKEVEKQLKGGTVVNFVNRYKCKDGSYKTFEWQATFAKHGIVYATAKDITKRKKAEEKLKSEKEFSQAILNTIPSGMDIVDENLEILYMNKTFLEKFGKKSIGKRCYRVYKDNKKQCEKCPLKKPVKVGQTKTLITSGVAGGKTFRITHTGFKLPNGKKVILEFFEDATDIKK